ncbi:hypothetical protein OIU78_024274 [Salix suchowensis]|nr:hypothetical protein OIU78_024274 [Salix suchowensis]
MSIRQEWLRDNTSFVNSGGHVWPHSITKLGHLVSAYGRCSFGNGWCSFFDNGNELTRTPTRFVGHDYGGISWTFPGEYFLEVFADYFSEVARQPAPKFPIFKSCLYKIVIL